MVETTSTDSTAYRALYTTAISRGHSIHNSDCPNYGSALKIIAAIDDPPVIVKILSHLGLPSSAPPRAPTHYVGFKSFKPFNRFTPFKTFRN